MNAADNPQIELLLTVSAKDQKTLALPLEDEIFGFHAQQAIEKLLKVLITAHGKPYAYTHNLQKLMNQLTDLHEYLPPFPMSPDQLTGYAVQFRYDDTASPVLSAEDRSQLIAAVHNLRSFVLGRLQELRSAGTRILDT